MSRMVYVSRSLGLCAGHRLKSDKLTPEENRAIFGRCYDPSGHGHNYEVVVTLRAPIDPVSGTAIKLSDLVKDLNEYVYEHLDHKNLDKDIEHFFTHSSTIENIAVYIWDILAPQLHGKLYEVKVCSTAKNAATYRGEISS